MIEAIQQLNDAARLIAPEIVLIATVCVMFLVGPFLVSPTGQASAGLRHRWGGLALAALGTAWLIWFNGDAINPADGPFLADGLTWFARGLSLTLGGLLVLLLWNQIDDGHAAEAHACLLSIVAGTNLVAAANDLVPGAIRLVIPASALPGPHSRMCVTPASTMCRMVSTQRTGEAACRTSACLMRSGEFSTATSTLLTTATFGAANATLFR